MARAPMTGEPLTGVKRLPKRLASTRSGTASARLAPLLGEERQELGGTTNESFVVVALGTLTKIARPPSRLKTTVVLLRPLRKFVPVMVSVSPIPRRLGDACLIVGNADRLVAAAAGLVATPPTSSSAATAEERRAVLGIMARTAHRPRGPVP
jgi:hypothetical protein